MRPCARPPRVALLAPSPLPEALLAGLIGQAAIGRLAKRSWIQSLAASSADRPARRWVMHRIPASSLRSRAPEPARLFEQLPALGEAGAGAVEAAHAFALTAVLAPPAQGSAGLRFLAAGVANGLGAADEVVAALESVYASGDETVAAAIPHTLQALVASPAAAALMAGLLKDPREAVRRQALALPLLAALVREPDADLSAGYDPVLDPRSAALPAILTELVRLLDEGTPHERERAAALLGRALLVNGGDLSAGGHTRRDLITALGERDDALADFTTVTAAAPEFAEAHLRRGQLLFERGQPAEAVPALQRAAACDPQGFLAHHLLAPSLYNLGRHAEAEAAAERAIELSPEVGEAWFFRGIARYAAGRAAEALDDLRRAAELDPSDERVRDFRAQLEAFLGKADWPGPRGRGSRRNGTD